MTDIAVDEKYFEDIRRKALLYDKMVDARRKGAQKTNNITPEQRSARAKKAAAARWGKLTNIE